MRKTILQTWVVGVLYFSAGASALANPETLSALTELFHSRFRTGYVANQCGSNISHFVQTALSQNLEISDAQVVMIENKGWSVFGMVNAELAREEGPKIANAVAGGPQFHPGETNWYHHFILIYDGHVFDFDFTNKPTVLPAQEYFDKMFLEEEKPQSGSFGTFYVGRDQKLDDYQVEIIEAREFLKRNQDSIQKLTLRDCYRWFQ